MKLLNNGILDLSLYNQDFDWREYKDIISEIRVINIKWFGGNVNFDGCNLFRNDIDINILSITESNKIITFENSNIKINNFIIDGIYYELQLILPESLITNFNILNSNNAITIKSNKNINIDKLSIKDVGSIKIENVNKLKVNDVNINSIINLRVENIKEIFFKSFKYEKSYEDSGIINFNNIGIFNIDEKMVFNFIKDKEIIFNDIEFFKTRKIIFSNLESMGYKKILFYNRKNNKYDIDEIIFENNESYNIKTINIDTEKSRMIFRKCNDVSLYVNDIKLSSNQYKINKNYKFNFDIEIYDSKIDHLIMNKNNNNKINFNIYNSKIKYLSFKETNFNVNIDNSPIDVFAIFNGLSTPLNKLFNVNFGNNIKKFNFYLFDFKNTKLTIDIQKVNVQYNFFECYYNKKLNDSYKIKDNKLIPIELIRFLTEKSLKFYYKKGMINLSELKHRVELKDIYDFLKNETNNDFNLFEFLKTFNEYIK